MKKTKGTNTTYDESQGADPLVTAALSYTDEDLEADEISSLKGSKAFCKSCDRLKECIMLNASLGFQGLADKINYGMCIINEDMQHLLLNKKYGEILEYNCNDLLGMKLTDVVTQGNATHVTEIIKTVFNGIHSRKKSISTMIRKDGKPVVVEIAITMLQWAGKPAAIVTTKDLTRWHDEKNLLREQLVSLESRIAMLSEESSDKEGSLLDYESKVDMISGELLQTNRAMSILSRNIDKEKKTMEKNIRNIVLIKVLPIINNLRKTPAPKKYRMEFDVLKEYVRNLVPGTDFADRIFATFTETEMCVATLITNGMSSQKIADALSISIETIKTHRKKIRRKLNIQNTETNLMSFLKTNLGN